MVVGRVSHGELNRRTVLTLSSRTTALILEGEEAASLVLVGARPYLPTPSSFMYGWDTLERVL